MQDLIVSGGSGGLGSAIVSHFQNSNWNVQAPSRDELNFNDDLSVKKWFSHKTVDLLICCVGQVKDHVLLKLPESNWDEMMMVNYVSAASCAKAVLPQMQKQQYGHIIFISSYAAFHPTIGQSAYATAKAGLIGLTTSLASIYGKEKIRVNAILPGYMKTNMTRFVPEKKENIILQQHALQAFNTPCAVAKFCHFLHESLPHTSGQLFQLDSRPFQ